MILTYGSTNRVPGSLEQRYVLKDQRLTQYPISTQESQPFQLRILFLILRPQPSVPSQLENCKYRIWHVAGVAGE